MYSGYNISKKAQKRLAIIYVMGIIINSNRRNRAMIKLIFDRYLNCSKQNATADE